QFGHVLQCGRSAAARARPFLLSSVGWVPAAFCGVHTSGPSAELRGFVLGGSAVPLAWPDPNAEFCDPTSAERCVLRQSSRFRRRTQRSTKWGPRNAAFGVVGRWPTAS